MSARDAGGRLTAYLLEGEEATLTYKGEGYAQVGGRIHYNHFAAAVDLLDAVQRAHRGDPAGEERALFATTREILLAHQREFDRLHEMLYQYMTRTVPPMEITMPSGGRRLLKHEHGLFCRVFGCSRERWEWTEIPQ